MGSFTFNPPSGTDLGLDNIYTILNHTIDVTYTPSGGEDTAVLTSVSISADYNDASVILTNGTSYATITGNYTLSLFPNQEIKYVDKNESNTSQPPTIVNDIALVPILKDVFSAKPDSSTELLITYTVTALTDDLQSDIATYTHTTRQTYDGIRDWLVDYITNNQGAI